MILLDEKYSSYLDGSKQMLVDGKKEKVIGYGYSCNGSDIVGYYVTTESYKIHYNLQEAVSYTHLTLPTKRIV